MARPQKTLSSTQIAQVEGLASVLSQGQMADYFGMARNTLAAIMERQPEVHALYKKGRARAIGAVAQGLLQRARDGDTASAIFYLKTQAGWRETQGLSLEGDVAIGATLRNVVSRIPLSDAEWLAMHGGGSETVDAITEGQSTANGETPNVRGMEEHVPGKKAKAVQGDK